MNLILWNLHQHKIATYAGSRHTGFCTSCHVIRIIFCIVVKFMSRIVGAARMKSRESFMIRENVQFIL